MHLLPLQNSGKGREEMKNFRKTFGGMSRNLKFREWFVQGLYYPEHLAEYLATEELLSTLRSILCLIFNIDKQQI